MDHPVPTCSSSEEGAEVLHALAPADAPLQQPLVSTVPVQQLCCGTHSTDGIRTCLPDPKETLQLPPWKRLLEGDQQITLSWEFRAGCGMHTGCLQG